MIFKIISIKKLLTIVALFIVTPRVIADHKPNVLSTRIQNDTWSFEAALNENLDRSGSNSAVALSRDGNTVAIGNEGIYNATEIYVRYGSTWKHEASLSHNDHLSFEGTAVALSGDGNLLAAGAPCFNDTAGAVQVYSRQGTSWQFRDTLTHATAKSTEGTSVAITDDGTIIAVGAPEYNGTGATHIYIPSGNNYPWILQTTLTKSYSNSQEGSSLAFSADGNTLAVGIPNYQTGAGATIIYIKSNNRWLYQETLTQHASDSREGYSVSLSADGNVLAAGAPAYSNDMGAIQIYVRSGTAWKHVTRLSQGREKAGEGRSVSLSANGTILAAGAPEIGVYRFNDSVACTYLYTQAGTIWRSTSISQPATHSDFEGEGVALSSDGKILITTAPDYDESGATFIYESEGE